MKVVFAFGAALLLLAGGGISDADAQQGACPVANCTTNKCGARKANMKECIACAKLRGHTESDSESWCQQVLPLCRRK
jgi:hypothetical protein